MAKNTCSNAAGAKEESLVRQYPPTPNPGYIILLWVGLFLIASTISKISIPTSSRYFVHSSINAIFTALYVFSKKNWQSLTTSYLIILSVDIDQYLLFSIKNLRISQMTLYSCLKILSKIDDGV